MKNTLYLSGKELNDSITLQEENIKDYKYEINRSLEEMKSISEDANYLIKRLGLAIENFHNYSKKILKAEETIIDAKTEMESRGFIV